MTWDIERTVWSLLAYNLLCLELTMNFDLREEETEETDRHQRKQKKEKKRKNVKKKKRRKSQR